MNVRLLIVSFLLLYFSNPIFGHSQESEFYFSKKGINAKLDTIKYEEFKKNGNPVSWIEPKLNNKIDSIVNVLRLRYPSAIKDSLKYMVLYSPSGNGYLWNDASNPDKSIAYSKMDYKNGYLVFGVSHSQGEEYVLFNPQTRILSRTKSYPVFIDSNTVYTIGSYDGEYFFQYKSLQSDKQILLLSNTWAMYGFYYANKKFYFEFSNGEKKKWLMVTINKAIR